MAAKTQSKNEIRAAPWCGGELAGGVTEHELKLANQRRPQQQQR